MPVGGLMLWLGLKLAAPLVKLEAWRTRRLLAPGLGDRVEWLTQTRAAALDASALELRRIERDLHDGAQAQLVALSLQLGMAEDLLDRDVEGARGLLLRSACRSRRRDVRAREPWSAASTRPCCAERGLAGALDALAVRSPVPVSSRVRLARPLPAPLESALYFSAVELVTNAIRHSGASQIEVSVDERDGRLVLRVADDGRGGADLAGGSGLRGLAAAARAVRRRVDRVQPRGLGDRRDRGAAVRVVVAEDLSLLRDGLTRMFDAYGFEVVAALEDGSNLAERAGRGSAPTSPSWTSASHRPSPTRASARPSTPAGRSRASRC